VKTLEKPAGFDPVEKWIDVVYNYFKYNNPEPEKPPIP
jgi:hypothetical protein